MVYRCVHCVYAEVIDKQTCDMKCLKKNEIIKCMDNCCNELILIPLYFLSHLLYVSNKEKGTTQSWFDCDRKAKNILDKYGFYGMTVPEE